MALGTLSRTNLPSGSRGGGLSGSVDSIARRVTPTSPTLTGPSNMSPSSTPFSVGFSDPRLTRMGVGTGVIPTGRINIPEFAQQGLQAQRDAPYQKALSDANLYLQSQLALNQPTFNQFADERHGIMQDLTTANIMWGANEGEGRIWDRQQFDFEIARERQRLQELAIRAQAGGVADQQAYLNALEQFARRHLDLTNQQISLQESEAGRHRDINLREHGNEMDARGSWLTPAGTRGQHDIKQSYAAQMQALGISREQAKLAFDREMAQIQQGRRSAARAGADINRALQNLGIDRREFEEGVRRWAEDHGLERQATLFNLNQALTSNEAGQSQFALNILDQVWQDYWAMGDTPGNLDPTKLAGMFVDQNLPHLAPPARNLTGSVDTTIRRLGR